MKNKLAPLILLFIPLFVAAADVCEGQGQQYGNGEGKDIISASCLMQIKESADSNSRKQFTNGLLVFGHMDIIFIEQEGHAGRPLIIAGGSTRLKNILSITLDEVNDEMAVLDESGEVLFFSPHKAGNISPLRVLKTNKLSGATDVKVLPQKDQVAVLKASERKILFYSRLANIKAHTNKRKLDLIKTVTIPPGIDPLVYFQNLK